MSSDIDHVLAELGQRIQAYQSAVDDYDREVARRLGVNETDLRCLELLISAGEMLPSELGSRLGLTTGSVTAMLDRLDRLGLLTRTPHPVDRRKTIVRATELAISQCAALMEPYISEGTEVVRGRYSADQLNLVADFLATTTEVQMRHVERLRTARAVKILPA
jgi:DNA-binding MarR family transcriptional regulator